MSLKVKELETLDVYLCNEKAGVLKRTNFGCRFEFTQRFLDQNKNVSFHLKASASPLEYRGDNLPPFFAGLLPEGLRLKSLLRKIKTSEDDLFSILGAVGSSCVGDVYIKTSYQPIIPSLISDLTKTDFYKLFQKNIESTDIHSQDEALAGVQEKISASMINFPLSIVESDKFYILKLNSKDKPRIVENEFFTLKLAQKCGLNVNKSKIVTDKNQNKGLLVERFDRYFKGGELKMLHQEDACQFLNRYPADKYRLSFKEVCEGVVKYASAPKIEVFKLLELYAFSYLIGNGDLHAKNISLQVLGEGKKITLTPHYDLLTTYIYKDHKMALKINGRDDKIKKKDFISFAQSFNVPEKAVETMLKKLLHKINLNHRLMHAFMSNKEKSQWQAVFEKRCKDLS